MLKRDIIVIGASAGGLPPLKTFVSSLPPGFGGSIFIVLHIPPYSESRLAFILSKSGPLKAIQPKDGEVIKPGIIYVAANDHHLLIENSKVIVKKGPKENRFRPSVDALFRSAAYVYGSRVIGIVLSGMLNDGTSGLWTVKRLGGVTIIQEPGDADYPQMPQNVLEYVKVDYTIPVAEMAALVMKLSESSAPKIKKISAKEMKLLELEVLIATRADAFDMGIMNFGELTPFTCPDCHGALARLKEGKLIRFRCHTGHSYTASTLLAELSTSVEQMLWQGMRGMEEMNLLLLNIEKHLRELGHKKQAAIFNNKAGEAAHRARIMHDSIFQQEQISEDIRYNESEMKKATGKRKAVKRKPVKKTKVF